MKKVELIVFSLICAIYFGLVNQYWNLEWDVAFYIELARSIVSGKGFTYLGYPQTKFLFGFPLMLSPIVWFWGNNYLLMNVLIVLCALGSIFATFWLFTQYFTRQYSMFIATLTALSYLTVKQSTYIMTDIPFMLFSLLAAALFTRFLRESKLYFTGILTALLMIISALLRMVGVSIVLGALTYLFLTKGVQFRIKKAVFILVVVLTPIAAWQVRNNTLKVDPQDKLWQLEEFIPYGQLQLRKIHDEPASGRVTLIGMVQRIVKNGAYYAGHTFSIIVGRQFDTSIERLKKSPVSVLVLMSVIPIVVILGFFTSLCTRKYFFDFYVFFYIATIFTPSFREPRYLLPILPFLLHYFIIGAEVIVKRIIRGGGDKEVAVCDGIMLCVSF